MTYKLYTRDPCSDERDPAGSYWRFRGHCKTARGAVLLRRKLEHEGYDKDVSISCERVEDGPTCHRCGDAVDVNRRYRMTALGIYCPMCENDD